MNWRIATAIVGASIIGGAAGGAGGAFLEHRWNNDSSSAAVTPASTPSGTPTQTASADQVAEWFGSRTAEACPSLKAWGAQFAIASLSKPDPNNWEASRLRILQGNDARAGAYRGLLPFTTATGRRGVDFLIDTESRLQDALTNAKSAAEYEAAAAKIPADQLRSNTAILSAALASCPKA